MFGLKATLKKQPGLPLVGEAYTSCDELPLWNFIKCSLENDTKYLIKSGNPQNLDQLWDAISDEYASISNNQKARLMLDLCIKMNAITTRISCIQVIIDFLSVKRNDELIEMLKNQFSFNLKYDDLERDLPITVNLAKTDVMKLRKLEAEYKELKEEEETGPSITMQTYVNQLVEISKWAKVRYTVKDTTVSEYVALINKFNAENK